MVDSRTHSFVCVKEIRVLTTILKVMHPYFVNSSYLQCYTRHSLVMYTSICLQTVQLTSLSVAHLSNALDFSNASVLHLKNHAKLQRASTFI